MEFYSRNLTFSQVTIHTVDLTKFLYHETFWKISVKTISLVNSLLNNWFHEIIFKWYKNLVNSTVCNISVKSMHYVPQNAIKLKNFREINSFVIYSVKNVDLTKKNGHFCLKIVIVFLTILHTIYTVSSKLLYVMNSRN